MGVQLAPRLLPAAAVSQSTVSWQLSLCVLLTTTHLPAPHRSLAAPACWLTCPASLSIASSRAAAAAPAAWRSAWILTLALAAAPQKLLLASGRADGGSTSVGGRYPIMLGS